MCIRDSPCIALCNTDAPLDFIDVVIPCNNKIPKAISLIFWMLAREVMIFRGQLPKNSKWDEVMVDLFIARDLETIRSQQEQAKKEEEEAKREGDDGKKEPAQIKAGDQAEENDW